MRTIFLSLLILGACAKSEPAHAEETTPPLATCHKVVNKVPLGGGITRLIFNCDPADYLDVLPSEPGASCTTSTTEVGIKITCGETVSQLKHGQNGAPGRGGSPGTDGDDGASAGDVMFTACIHGDDHIYRTTSISLLEFVSDRIGERGAGDYKGNCENACGCDLCPLNQFDESQIHFFH